MIKTFLKIVFILAILGAIGWILYGKFFAPKAAGMAGGAFPTLVEIQKPEKKNITQTLQAVGTVFADEQITLQPEISGRIIAVPPQEGAAVEKGTVLFQLEDREQRAALQQAEANLGLARTNSTRFTALQKVGGISTSELDKATAELKTGQANVMSAKAMFDKTKIVAPFSGVIGLRKVSIGDTVAPTQMLASLAKLDQVKVDFTVPEQQAPLLQNGQTVSLQSSGTSDQTFTGTILAIDPVLDSTNRTMMVRAVVPNPEQALKPGSFVNIVVGLKEKPDALMIPEGSIIPQGNEHFVFVKSPDDKAKMRKITIGQRQGTQVEVVDGLTENDDVITTGQIKLREDAPVTIKAPGAPSAPDAAAPAASVQEKPAASPAAENSSAEPTDASKQSDPEGSQVAAPQNSTTEQPAADEPAAQSDNKTGEKH